MVNKKVIWKRSKGKQYLWYQVNLTNPSLSATFLNRDLASLKWHLKETMRYKHRWDKGRERVALLEAIKLSWNINWSSQKCGTSMWFHAPCMILARSKVTSRCSIMRSSGKLCESERDRQSARQRQGYTTSLYTKLTSRRGRSTSDRVKILRCNEKSYMFDQE